MGWRAGLLEGEVDTTGRACVEWAIEETGHDTYTFIMLGVTDLAAPPAPGTSFIRAHPGSRMLHCRDSHSYPGNRDWGAGGRQLKKGDRVGLLVEAGRLWVHVNGARLGPGPMAEDLPPRVRFAAELGFQGARVRVVEGAAAPA